MASVVVGGMLDSDHQDASHEGGQHTCDGGRQTLNPHSLCALLNVCACVRGAGASSLHANEHMLEAIDPSFAFQSRFALRNAAPQRQKERETERQRETRTHTHTHTQSQHSFPHCLTHTHTHSHSHTHTHCTLMCRDKLSRTPAAHTSHRRRPRDDDDSDGNGRGAGDDDANERGDDRGGGASAAIARRSAGGSSDNGDVCPWLDDSSEFRGVFDDLHGDAGGDEEEREEEQEQGEDEDEQDGEGEPWAGSGGEDVEPPHATPPHPGSECSSPPKVRALPTFTPSPLRSNDHR